MPDIRTSDFSFDLPKELIAQDPLEDRSASRLLVMDKNTGEIGHDVFRNMIEYLHPGDCLVLNNTKVIPARLFGRKMSKEFHQLSGSGNESGGIADASDSAVKAGAVIEVLLLKRKSGDVWETLVKPGKKAGSGAVLEFGDGLLKGTVLEVTEEGNRLIQFQYDGIFEEVLDALGEMPLPPYITHALQDKTRYQTVYARYDGSAAAPTAGLHFTEELLDRIAAKGVRLAYVTLHVGLGTFRPVKVENILEHHMHSEYFHISQEAADAINTTKRTGGRVICVGTTSCRTIESAAGRNCRTIEDAAGGNCRTIETAADGHCRTVETAVDGNGIQDREYVEECCGDTDIFIYPGYRFRVTDCLITNFHLPESTLMMLVSALADRDHILAAYEAAITERYRFFSFGDAMFLK